MRTPFAVRRAVRLGAGAAIAAGLVAAGLTTPAHATETDQLWIHAPYKIDLPVGAAAGAEPQARTLTLGLYHDNSAFTVTDGRLTVDISGLTGVAEVSWPESCSPSGTTAVCTVPEVTGSSDIAYPVKLTVRAVPGAAAGASGRITYQAQATTTQGAEPLVAPGNDTTVTLGSGPDLSLQDPEPLDAVAPGTVHTVPLSVTNRGNEPADGVQLTFYVSRGLTLGEVAPGCTSTPVGGTTDTALTKVQCAFDDTVEPGGTFTLPQPLKATIADHALYERLDISVTPGSGATDLSTSDNYASARIRATNTADFAVRGVKAAAGAGETVATGLTFRNRGPAWVANLSSGEPVAVVDFTVPEGATATAVPQSCYARSLDGTSFPTRTGAPLYQCRLPYWVTESQTVTLPFTLRVDTVVPDATGKVTLRAAYGDQPLPFDPNVRNNTAKLVLNPSS
ncbi:hypothetical protein AMK26_26445 [Streptomyces sp. CB03234]|uniref:hypothetical protein n=1 Tax=Streptomyces sp. (strain CB03234) TaxID=1703937 RepID=UPI00093AD484|nr:hypothetical protein [Streptomyces sp. CB03234]OKJ99569.1 hypothetical protein AMK26_26445 [Streptomyces sp. CB03234]